MGGEKSRGLKGGRGKPEKKEHWSAKGRLIKEGAFQGLQWQWEKIFIGKKEAGDY